MFCHHRAAYDKSRRIRSAFNCSPPGCLIIAFAAPDDAKSGPFIEPPRRLIVFLDFEEDGAHAAAGEMAEMGQQQVARQAAAAMAGIDRDRQYFGFVRRHARDRKADHLAPLPQAMHQRVAFASAWSRIRLRPSRDETTRRAIAPAVPRRAGVAGSTTGVPPPPPFGQSRRTRPIMTPGCDGLRQRVLWRLGVGRAQIKRPRRRGVRIDRGAEPRHPGDVGRRLRDRP